jgi:hypothetical protein
MPEGAARLRGDRLTFPSAVWRDQSPVPMESDRRLQIFDLARFLDANRPPPRIKSGAGFRLNVF